MSMSGGLLEIIIKLCFVKCIKITVVAFFCSNFYDAVYYVLKETSQIPCYILKCLIAFKLWLSTVLALLDTSNSLVCLVLNSF